MGSEKHIDMDDVKMPGQMDDDDAGSGDTKSTEEKEEGTDEMADDM